MPLILYSTATAYINNRLFYCCALKLYCDPEPVYKYRFYSKIRLEADKEGCDPISKSLLHFAEFVSLNWSKSFGHLK